MNVTFLNELFAAIAERGRDLLSAEPPVPGVDQIDRLCLALLSHRGEATGMALASELTAVYGTLTREERLRFFGALDQQYGPNRERLKAAAARYVASGSAAEERQLIAAAESSCQELLRRINLVPGNTARLVAMRADLLGELKSHPKLASVDADFVHLFSSWFNRGFLVMQRIDWQTSASILDRIIRYEQVHTINDWNDLRRRIDPIDRRCYAFFHPAMIDEPLIFVEVALTDQIPAAIGPLLAAERTEMPIAVQTTAVFYSISNTQVGLRGISFGSFLIKQVADELRRERPKLQTFVTLSPLPGFAAWLAAERARPNSPALAGIDPALLTELDGERSASDRPDSRLVREALLPLAAWYLVKAKNEAGRPIDPVARFHLGNGARLERLNGAADSSAKGQRQSHGVMVNYHYALAEIEHNHEAHFNEGAIAASPAVRALLKPERSRRRSNGSGG